MVNIFFFIKYVNIWTSGKIYHKVIKLKSMVKSCKARFNERERLWKKYQDLQEKAGILDAKSQMKDRPKKLESKVKKAYNAASKIVNKVNKIDDSRIYQKCIRERD